MTVERERELAHAILDQAADAVVFAAAPLLGKKRDEAAGRR